MQWILKRLKERSTWSALIALASIAGLNLKPELSESIITAGTAVIAVIFAVTADSKPEVKNEERRVPEPATAEPQTFTGGRTEQADPEP